LPESNYPKDKIYGSHQDGAGQTLGICIQIATLAQMAKVLVGKKEIKLIHEKVDN